MRTPGLISLKFEISDIADSLAELERRDIKDVTLAEVNKLDRRLSAAKKNILRIRQNIYVNHL